MANDCSRYVAIVPVEGDFRFVPTCSPESTARAMWVQTKPIVVANNPFANSRSDL
ncbi:hypothetical protein [Aeoliella sp.]|uniref:hypothetical protein n=1 Tax=Aeoliella sp. TaxID=2795800 RepID=UPI003CCBD638